MCITAGQFRRESIHDRAHVTSSTLRTSSFMTSRVSAGPVIGFLLADCA